MATIITTIITDANLRGLVQHYVSNKKKLPDDLKGVPIGQWNVSTVTNMQGMFYHCEEFEQPLNDWNVSNVTNMQSMFFGCIKFDQPLNAWNVSNVTNPEYMFYNCKEFDQPLNAWNVSNVTNMEYMFYNCKEFNQPLNAWNCSNVTDMQQMFSGCVAFDQPLNAWNCSNVTNMHGMFYNCPIRDSYKPGAAPEVTPTTARRMLRQFYQAHHRQLPTNLAEKCNQETYCPITYMSLKRLRDMKRLVVLEGQCYAFYAFIQKDPLLSNPFTRQPWSEQATADIAAIREYRDLLKAEYEELPAKTPTPRRTRRGRTARQRQQPTTTRKSATRKSRTPSATSKSRTPSATSKSRTPSATSKSRTP
jgi:surface protein